jgi:predicted DNA binding CopG/RHH family protein
VTVTEGGGGNKRTPAKEQMVKGTTKNWEEGKLGLSEDYAIPASQEELAALDLALELRPISIRLQTTLIAKLKFIAHYHGIGYQPLVRDILNRFAGHELVRIVNQIEAEKQAESALSDEDSPAARYMRNCA